jgi:hypothetical protein
MKTLGTAQLHEEFEWKPQQLLAMIKEIDQICPEEGMPSHLTNNSYPQAQGMNPNTNYE